MTTKTPRSSAGPPLPPPLIDVLAGMRWWYRIQLALGVATAILMAFARVPLIAFFLPVPLIAIPWYMLRTRIPKNPPDFLYLRNFRTDATSVEIKHTLHVLLGAQHRLGGIRAPGRRLPYFLRPLLLPYLVLRYSDHRHMGLEASNKDWPARLWRSLGSCHGVFLDAREITKAVRFEIGLVYKSMGLARIAFIVDSTQTSAEWRALLGRLLSLDASVLDQVRLLPWPEHAPVRQDLFFREARSFVADAGRVRPTPPYATLPMVAKYVDHAPDAEHDSAVAGLTVGLGILVMLVLPRLVGRVLGAEMGGIMFPSIMACLLSVTFLGALRLHIGTRVQALIADRISPSTRVAGRYHVGARREFIMTVFPYGLWTLFAWGYVLALFLATR